MKAPFVKRLTSALDAYIDAPTQHNQEELMTVATQYREDWIAAQAEGNLGPRRRRNKSGPTTSYEEIRSVAGKQPDGTEVTLKLQMRHSASVEKPWPVISWRSRLEPGGHNRRFYVTKNQIWRIKASLALSMLEELHEQGGLDEQYFDLERNSDFHADEIDTSIEEITMADERPGGDPFFMVLDDPNPEWRKILIVDRDTGEATFRSTTTSQDYMPRKTLRVGCKWDLDNSMQDASVQHTRKFLKALRKLVPTLER